MTKVRVYELAKKLGLTSKEVLAALNDMGEFVRTASSTIEAPVVRRLSEKLRDDAAKSEHRVHKPAATQGPNLRPYAEGTQPR